jgi:polyisoprenoid-binding protein YceI
MKINSRLFGKLFSKLLFSALLSTGANARSEAYTIDNAHSELGFKIKHLVVATVRGRFERWNGGFNFDAKSGKVSDLKIEVETASISTSEADRDKHLRSDDFFKTGAFPKATFEAKDFTTKKGKEVSIDGTLTLLGVSKPTKLKIEYSGEAVDPWGNTKQVFEVSGKIKRSDFGMSWNKNLDKGGVLLSDEVELEIEAQAAAKPADKK